MTTTTDIITTGPSAAAVVAASLPVGLRERALRVVASDRAAGAALLAKCRELRAARAEAEYGDWRKFLKVVNIHERASQRHIAIAERADVDSRFEQAVLNGFLLYATAALAAQADEELLSELLELPEPPSRRQVEALLASPAEPEPEPDTGVGSVDWAVQRLLRRCWTTDTQATASPDDPDYVVRDSESGERWVMDGDGLILAAQILDQDPQISAAELFNKRLPPVCEEPVEVSAIQPAANVGDPAAFLATLDQGTAWRIPYKAPAYMSYWPGLLATTAAILAGRLHTLLAEAQQAAPGALSYELIRAADALWRRERAEATGFAERQRDPAARLALQQAVAALEVRMQVLPALADDLAGCSWRRYGSQLELCGPIGERLAIGSPEQPDAIIDMAREALELREDDEEAEAQAVEEADPPRSIDAPLTTGPRDTSLPDDLREAGLKWQELKYSSLWCLHRRNTVFAQHSTRDGAILIARRALAAEAIASVGGPHGDLVAAAHSSAPARSSDGPHAWVQLALARVVPIGDHVTVAQISVARESAERWDCEPIWPFTSSAVGVLVGLVVGDLRDNEEIGRSLRRVERFPDPARGLLRETVYAAWEIWEVYHQLQRRAADAGGVLNPIWIRDGEQVWRYSLTSDDGETLCADLDGVRQALEAQAAEGAGVPPALPEPTESQADELVERARALGAEVDVEPGGQRYHVLPPDRGSDEWLTAEQLAERVVSWEARRPAPPAQAEEGTGGAGTLPSPSWRNDSPRVAQMLSELLACPDANQAAMIAAQLSWALAGGDSTRWTLDLAEVLNPDMLAVLVPIRDATDLVIGEKRARDVLSNLNGSVAAWAGVVKSVAKQLREVGE